MINNKDIFLHGEITQEVVMTTIQNLFKFEDENTDINIYICSSGGCITSALGLYDVIKTLTVNVNTIAIGEVCSAAAIILLAGDKKYAYEHSYIMFHEIKSANTAEESLDEFNARHKLFNKLNWAILNITAEASLLPRQDADVMIGSWMSAEDCLVYNIIDGIIN